MDNVTLEVTKSKDRARKEADIHSKLHHPSIVELYDFFEQPEAMYLVSLLLEIHPDRIGDCIGDSVATL